MRTQNINHALPSGSRLDTYEIIEAIGSGGFGITYKALDTNLKHLVAIKEYLPVQLAWRADESTVIPRTDSDTESFEYGLEQFIEEGRTLARFKHTNIVRVIRYFKDNGTAYLVMEYEHGQTLKEYLQSCPRPDETMLLELLSSILKGLKSIHDQGFLHRDVKPSNIYLRDKGEALLIDFGSAREALTRQTQALTGIVSEGFAPFEQYTGNIQQTPATDLYGLGATLYLAISGQTPMNALDRYNTLHTSNKDPLTASTQVGATLYNHFFLTLIDWLLEIYPENRPQTVGELIESLNNQSVPDLTRTQINTVLLHQNTIPATKSLWKTPWVILTSLMTTIVVAGSLYYLASRNIEPDSPDTISDPFAIKDKNSGVRIISVLRTMKGGNFFKIDSQPANAKVFINDVYRGTTPYILSNPKNKSYAITIKKNGYLSSTHAIFKQSGYSYLLRPTLKTISRSQSSASKTQSKSGISKQKRYKLAIEVWPENAKITFINSNLVYSDNMRLVKGHYKFKVSAPNHKSATRELKIDYADRSLKVVLSHIKLLHTYKFDNWVHHILRLDPAKAIVAVVIRRGNTRVINLKTGKLIYKLSTSYENKLAVSRKLTQLFTAKDGVYKLWNLGNGKMLHETVTGERDMTSVLLNPDGNGWISSESNSPRELKLHNFNSYPKIINTFKIDRSIRRLIQYSPNGRYLLALDYHNKGDLLIIDVLQQRVSTILKGYGWRIHTAGFSPNGKTVVSLSDDNKIRLWDIKSKTPIWTGKHPGFADSPLTISSNGLFAATIDGTSNSLIIWDLKTGKKKQLLSSGHTDRIFALTFLGNSSRLASGSADKTLRLWDVSDYTKTK